jgi:hypothetical protein
MTIPPITVPYFAACIVLGLAGILKLLTSGPTQATLAAAGMTTGRAVIRVGAAGEVAVAALGLAGPARLGGALVATSYAGFATFVTLALRHRWPIVSCGCFGRPDTPAARRHLVLNIGCAACALWWAVAAPPRPWQAIVHPPLGGIAILLASFLVAYLGYLVMSNPLLAARFAGQPHPAGLPAPGPAPAPAARRIDPEMSR